MTRREDRQTPEQQLMRLMRSLYGSRPGREISEREFKAAGERVGQNDKTRLEWAIRFSQEPFDAMSAGDRVNAQLEIGAFIHPMLASSVESGEVKSIPFVGALFPDGARIGKFKDEFLAIIKCAAINHELSFTVSEMSVSVGRDGVLYRPPPYALRNLAKLSQAQIDAAKLNLAKLVAKRWGYLGLCDRKRHGCGRYFLMSRSDKQFCSKTCLNRSTTYRQRGKEPTV